MRDFTFDVPGKICSLVLPEKTAYFMTLFRLIPKPINRIDIFLKVTMHWGCAGNDNASAM